MTSNKFLTLLFIYLCFFSNTLLAAKVYKWVDENGEIHYSQKRPQISKPHKMEIMRIKTNYPAPSNPEQTTFYSEHCENGNTKLCDKDRDTWNKKVEENFAIKEQQLIKSQVAEQKKQAEERLHRENILKKNEAERKERLTNFYQGKSVISAENQRSLDEKVISDCTKRRDVFCNKGADFIRKEAQEKATRQREKYERDRRNIGMPQAPEAPIERRLGY